MSYVLLVLVFDKRLNSMQRKACEYILRQFLPPIPRACLLIPELTLSILTSSSPLWHIPYDEAMKKLDRTDPWWAFLWPGSQALSRYILISFHIDEIFISRQQLFIR